MIAPSTTDPNGRIALFQEMPIFGGIRADVLEFLLQRVQTREMRRGDWFLREGEQGDTAYVLEVGSVSIWKCWNGRQYLLRHLGRGDCFGEVALLDLGPRSASVRADTDACAIVLHPADLFEVSRRDMEQFALIYMNLGRELSRRLRLADERLFRAQVTASPPAGGYPFGVH